MNKILKDDNLIEEEKVSKYLDGDYRYMTMIGRKIWKDI